MSLILLGILNSQAAGVSAGAYDLLETQVLTSSAASVTFTGLDSYTDYKHLQFRIVARSDRATQDYDVAYINFNNDTGSSYAHHRIQGTGSSVTIYGNSGLTVGLAGYLTAAGDSVTNSFAGMVLDILDFSSTTKNTTTRGLWGNVSDDTYIGFGSNLWNTTSAVTEIDFTCVSNYIAGSRFSLYGVK